jgi:hypothetical protein
MPEVPMIGATPPTSNNDRLKELVRGAGLAPAVALTLFNRGLSNEVFSESAWKALFADQSSSQFRSLEDELLAHAERAFSHLKP